MTIHLVGPSETYTTIQAAVNAAYAGDTVRVKAGTYREQVIPARSGTSAARITIEAFDTADRPTIKGSDIVTGWTLHSGSVWKVTGIALEAQQVFANGTYLEFIGEMGYRAAIDAATGYTVYTPIAGTSAADVIASSFFHDGATGTLYVWIPGGGDPNGVTMEVSTRRSVFKLDNHSYIDLKNLTVRHNGSMAHSTGGGAVILGSYCRAYNVDASWCDFSGIALGYAKTGAQVINCVANYNGCMGMAADTHTGFLVDGCVISRNNTRRFSYTWISAGIKITTDAAGTVQNCRVGHNDGVGIWWDYCDATGLCTTQNNYLHDNAQGIMFEGSKNASITNNRDARDQRRGIYISASDDVVVSGNTIEGNLALAAIDICGMPRSGKTLTNVSVQTNYLYKNAGERDLLISAVNGSSILNIDCDYTTVVRATAPILWYGTPGTWVGTNWSTVAGFQTASGHIGNRYFAP